jgi:hypothetical protein
VTPDWVTLDRLRAEGQGFFLPYYRAIVARHPGGIEAAEVKRLVADQILVEFGIDIFDPAQTGLNPSTKRSSADQWANNLVSNEVLDEFMLVVRANNRAILYPGASDNSRTLPPPGNPLNDVEVSKLNQRTPRRIEAPPGQAFRRSLQLAEYVRGLSGRTCAAADPRCTVFDGRDGQPYVEVHHLIPMAMQSKTQINLDRSTNMVPVCPGCHACLHRGAIDRATEVLDRVLTWFESTHGFTFGSANGHTGFDVSPGGLLAMYGSDLTAE